MTRSSSPKKNRPVRAKDASEERHRARESAVIKKALRVGSANKIVWRPTSAKCSPSDGPRRGKMSACHFLQGLLLRLTARRPPARAPSPPLRSHLSIPRLLLSFELLSVSCDVHEIVPAPMRAFLLFALISCVSCVAALSKDAQFLADNALKPGVVTLPSGLQYKARKPSPRAAVCGRDGADAVGRPRPRRQAVSSRLQP